MLAERRRRTPAETAWASYERVQALKRDQHSIIDGVNFGNVIAVHLYNTSILYWLKIIAFCLLFAPRTEATGSERPLLIYYSCRYKRRSDYDYIFDRLVTLAGDRGDVAETREVLSVKQLWPTLSNWTRGWRATSGYLANPMQRLAAAALVAKFLSADPMFRMLAADRSRVVTFSDAAPHDNLLAQLAKLEGAVTVTVQHGQYRVLDQANISVDAEAYANFVSDRLLCWGEATCHELAQFGIARTRLVVTGWIRNWEGVHAKTHSTDTFGVLLNGATCARSNLEMIRVANRLADELDMRFILRMHPTFRTFRYSALVSANCASIGVMAASDYVQAVDFSIAHMSGATIEMVEIGSPVYVLDDGRLTAAFRAPGLSFSGFDTLLAAVRADLATRDRGINRADRFRRWFNDDTDQDVRILATMLDGGG